MMGGQGGGSGGQKIEQIDPLGSLLRNPGKGSEIDQQKRAAADPKGGQNPGDRPGGKGDPPGHAVSAFQAP